MIVKLRAYIKNNLYFLLSFFVPIVILALAYADFGIYPSGSKTILISDMEGQYIDFYTALYDMIKDGRSLLYSWRAGIGLNFVGIYAYYMASPFSLIILLFQRQDLVDALYYITLLKIGSAGVSFSLYLKYLYKEDRLPISIFSVVYALMSYNIVYSFHIMWLDGVVFLPLVLLGVEKIIRENRPLIFTLSLITVFIANFYISYMVGVFSYFYFLAAYFSIYPLKSGKVFIRKLLMFFLSAVLAAGSAAFLLLPAYFALKNGLGMSNLSLDWKVNFNMFNLLSKLPIGSYDTLTDGLPNIYCGLLTLIALPLYFTNKKIGLKEKFLYLCLIILVLLSFSFDNLNLMWHGFDEPNWFPYRYSFLFSFILIILALRGFIQLDKSQSHRTVMVYGACILVLFFIKQHQYNYLPDSILFISLLFFTIYGLLLWLYMQRYAKKVILLLAILIAISGENYINARYLMSCMDKEFKYAAREKYNASVSNLNDLVEQIGEKDNSFYRMDRTIDVKRSFNDPMNLGYNGISHFSSMINGKTNVFLNKLGFITPVDAAVDYAGATLVTDSLLGVKYILSDRPRGFGYKEIISRGSIAAYENTYALPLAFPVDMKLLELSTEGNNPFELQNDMLSLLSGSKYEEIFSPLSVVDIKLHNLVSSNIDGKQEYKRIDAHKEAYVEYIIENQKDQQVYVYLPSDVYSPVEVYVNDDYIERYLHFYNNTVLDLGFHNKNEDLRVKLVLTADSFAILNKYFYGLDTAEFDRTIGELKQRVFEIEEVRDTYIKGKAEVDEKKLLFTSIPFDPGWQVFVDGSRAETEKIAGAFIGVELPKGQHNIEFRFRLLGLYEGMFTSIISFILVIFLIKYKS